MTRSMAKVAVPRTGTGTPFVKIRTESPRAKTTFRTVHHFINS